MSINLTVKPADIASHTGFSRSTAYAKINPKSKYFDVTFPRPFKTGARSVVWLKADIDAWIKLMKTKSESKG